MEYILVDKNYIVPIVITETNYNNILSLLFKQIYQRNQLYINNVYIVKFSDKIYNSLIFIKNNNLCEKNNSGVKLLLNNFNEYYNNIINQNNNNHTETENYNISNDDLNITITETRNPYIKINNNQIHEINNNQINEINNNQINEHVENNENNEKKRELIKACEEVMDLHNLEQTNIKKLELNLKSINTKISKLQKQKKDKLFDDLMLTKNDYHTWKKIKYNIIEKEDLYKDTDELEIKENNTIPILFASKYNYIDKIQENNEIKVIYNKINNLDLEKIFINNNLIEIDDIILKFSEKYSKISKNNLHYNFEHDWDYLTDEMNTNPKNNQI